jgi:hypothetical protein
LQLFYLHWLFLIGFYFQFHPYSFDFFYLFSNFIFILLISICFVLNHFLDEFVFFFNFTLRHLFSFNFYVKFGPNSFNCYFLIIFLMDLFCTIPSLNMEFYLIFP